MLRLVDLFRGNGFAVAAVVITQYAGQPAADVFRNRLNALGIPAKLHYPIEGYPHDVDLIVLTKATARTSLSRPRVHSLS